MKAGNIILLAGLLLLVSCANDWLEKPKGLIPEKKMVDMLVDLHIANVLYQNQGGATDGKITLKPEEYYYSVLKKYNIPDTLFEQSFVYYSSFPKDFEKMYAAALDKANQLQEQYKSKLPEPVEMKAE